MWSEKLQWDQIRLVRAREEYHRFSKAAGLPEQHERMEKAARNSTKGFTSAGKNSTIKSLDIDDSIIAEMEGAECIAEVEVLLFRGQKVPEKAIQLYNEFVKGGKK